MKEPPEMKAMFGGSMDGGFFDIPVAAPGQLGKARTVVLGAPIATPYTTVGPYCAAAPQAIRSAFGWPGVLDHYDFDMGGKLLGDRENAVDWGDLHCSETDFAANRRLIRESVKIILDNNAVPLVFGGDDSVPIPVLEAYEHHGPITILQLDAHIDWRDQVNGEKWGLSSNMRRASEMGWVENIFQVGARGMGSARERDYTDALEWGVRFFPMEAVRHTGISAIVEAIPENCNLYIALDIDVMDPAVVPAVIGPAPGGFHYWEVVSLFKQVASKTRISGFSLVELMPDGDINGRGALVAARIAATVMGLIAGQG
jgi:agmatinase